jgi:hypothetical protein
MIATRYDRFRLLSLKLPRGMTAFVFYRLIRRRIKAKLVVLVRTRRTAAGLSAASLVQRTPHVSRTQPMIDLTHSPRLANPQALVGVVRALGDSSEARTDRVEDPTASKHAVGGRSQIVRSMTARNGPRSGETGTCSGELCPCKFCSLRSHPLLQK